ncbi:hypothetical protein GCM10010420_08800 [Streptomyces glaucosporus]|uniref:Uncharacterized protein n=1 Tax=Streptomyces glaucosporus TaxID=284044 RepID=A0ABP5UVT3_9ACTN
MSSAILSGRSPSAAAPARGPGTASQVASAVTHGPLLKVLAANVRGSVTAPLIQNKFHKSPGGAPSAPRSHPVPGPLQGSGLQDYRPV